MKPICQRTHTQNIQIDSHETKAKQKEKLFYLLS